ncbi:hypothetical protein B484DRAFT_473279, partial [Ochromonadaceae sp. CCMP2298]
MSGNKGSKRPARGQGTGPSAPSAHAPEGTNLGSLMTMHAGVTPFEHNPTPATPATAQAAVSAVSAMLFSSPAAVAAEPPSSPTLTAAPAAPMSPVLAALMQVGASTVSPASATAPKGAKMKNGKKVTETCIVMAYSMVDGKRINLGFFLWNCFDRYLWLKGDVQYEQELFCCPEMGFLYPVKKFALLAAAGFARPGPAYLPPNSPVWRYIVNMSEGVES